MGSARSCGYGAGIAGASASARLRLAARCACVASAKYLIYRQIFPRAAWSSAGPTRTWPSARSCGSSWRRRFRRTGPSSRSTAPAATRRRSSRRSSARSSRARAGSRSTGPRQYGGRDASPWRHAILGEEMWRIGEPRSSQYMNVNWVGPTIMAYGTPEQKAPAPAAHQRGQRLLVSRLLGARGRLRSGLAAHARDPRRRRLRDQRLEDLDQLRELRRALLPDRAHRSHLEAPPGHLRAAGADADAGDRGARDPLGGRRPLLLRGLLQRRARAGLLSARPRERRLGGRAVRARVRAGRRGALRARGATSSTSWPSWRARAACWPSPRSWRSSARRARSARRRGCSPTA